MTTLWVLTLLLLAAWIYLLVFRGRFWRSDQVFEPACRPSLPDWPPVAVIVPARNEEETISEVLLSLLAQDYPGSFHLVLLDDRSTDGTAARAQAALAQSDTGDRATILTGEPLPAGWAGKQRPVFDGGSGGWVRAHPPADTGEDRGPRRVARRADRRLHAGEAGETRWRAPVARPDRQPAGVFASMSACSRSG